MLLNATGQFELAGSFLMEFAANRSDSPQITQLAGITALRLPQLPKDVPASQERLVSLAGQCALLAWRKKGAEARAAAEMMLREFPNQPNVNYLMGYVLLADAKDGALDSFEKEILVSPQHVQARLQISLEYLRRGEPEKGLVRAQEAAQLAPSDFMAQNVIGRIYLALNRPQEAVEALERSVRLQPFATETHYALANAYQRLGDTASAEKHRKIFRSIVQQRAAKAVDDANPK